VIQSKHNLRQIKSWKIRRS